MDASTEELRDAHVGCSTPSPRYTTTTGRQLRMAHLYLNAADAVRASDPADVPIFHTLDEATSPSTTV